MENYNFIKKLLHDLILSNDFMKKAFYELDKFIYLKNKNYQSEIHIFITSLPRSGTTALLNAFAESEELCSLKYKNMPFITSPNISKIFKQNEGVSKERYHKDGIKINLESPESFDEVFFSTYNEQEVIKELENYISLVLISSNKKRYLSKNNLNYKRIALIKKIFPNSKFVITIREPLYHSFSLLNQHKNFTNLQNNNSFAKRYMNYLGHYEFGNNHRTWFAPQKYFDYNNINYWLEQWFLFYDNIIKNYKDDLSCTFLAFEDFDKTDKIDNLKKILNLDFNSHSLRNMNKKSLTIDFDSDLHSKCSKLYSILR